MGNSTPLRAIIFLKSKSEKYGSDLTRIPIFRVLMTLDHEDRTELEDILFNRWVPYDED